MEVDILDDLITFVDTDQLGTTNATSLFGAIILPSGFWRGPLRVPTIIILTFASLTLLTCSGESKSQITGNSIPRSDQTFFLDENDYDVGCVDQTLGTKATDELFYGGRSPEQVEVDRIALCEKGMASADSNEPTSGATQMSMETQEQPQQRPRSDEGSDAKRESRDRERPRTGDGAAQALDRNERDQPSMDDRRQDPNNRDDQRPQSMCTGNDLDRGGLPLGPKCNVPLPQLPPGVTRATLASASLPKSNYQEPIESCQEFTGDQCSELTWEPVADMRAGEFVQIKISPSNPNVMYAGGQNNGASSGVLLSEGLNYRYARYIVLDLGDELG